jgi:hypothetical protein
MWTEQQAAENLEELLRRANAGNPQQIEGDPSCVVISLAEYNRLTGHSSDTNTAWKPKDSAAPEAK